MTVRENYYHVHKLEQIKLKSGLEAFCVTCHEIDLA